MPNDLKKFKEFINFIINKKEQKEFNNEIDKKTKEYQKKYLFKISSNPKHPTWNNEADAFKHAFMSAILSYRYNQAGSNFLGYGHELENLLSKNPLNGTNMDLWNNKVGRDIYNEVQRELKVEKQSLTSEQIENLYAGKIVEKMKNGELITEPKDSRNFYTDFGKPKSSISGFATPIAEKSFATNPTRVFTLEEIKNMPNKEFENNKPQILQDFADKKILSEEEAQNKIQSGELIWVNDYTKDDGTKVKGYYRSKG